MFYESVGHAVGPHVYGEFDALALGSLALLRGTQLSALPQWQLWDLPSRVYNLQSVLTQSAPEVHHRISVRLPQTLQG